MKSLVRRGAWGVGLWVMVLALGAGRVGAEVAKPEPVPTPGVGAVEVKQEKGKLIVSQKVIQEQPAAGLEAIAIDNLNGTVGVTGWDENKIWIGVVKKLTAPTSVEEQEGKQILQQIAVEGKAKGKRLEIKSVLPKLARGMNADVYIFVQVPKSMAVEAVTHNGNVMVNYMKKTVTAQTENGNIDSLDIGGKLTARTHNGNIDTGLTKGPVEATSGNGNVLCRVVNDDVKAETNAGNVEVDLSTSYAMPKVVSATTKTGSVKLDLSGREAGFTLDAQCGVGSIKSDYPIPVVRKGVGAQAKGAVGDGLVKIHLRSDTGGIRIQK